MVLNPNTKQLIKDNVIKQMNNESKECNNTVSTTVNDQQLSKSDIYRCETLL